MYKRSEEVAVLDGSTVKKKATPAPHVVDSAHKNRSNVIVCREFSSLSMYAVGLSSSVKLFEKYRVCGFIFFIILLHARTI